MTAKITDLITAIQIFLAAEMQILLGLFIGRVDASSRIRPEMLFAAGLLHKSGHRSALDWSQWECGLKRKSTKITKRRTPKRGRGGG